MNIRQLEIFFEVARHLSFSRAAEQLHMAQPAVSIAIKKLESDLDLQLFERIERRVYLTTEGEVLMSQVEGLLQQFRGVREQMVELHGLRAGTVSFSTTAMVGCYFLPDIISRFRQQYPNISLQVVIDGSAGTRLLLEADEIDMGVVNIDDVGEDLQAIPLLRDELVVCVAEDHPLASKKSVSDAVFCQQSLLLYRESYFLRKLAADIHKKRELEPDIVVETDSLGMIMEMTRNGVGATLSLKLAAESEPGVVGVPFAKPRYLNLGIGWKKDGYLSLANRAFLDFVAEYSAHS